MRALIVVALVVALGLVYNENRTLTQTIDLLDQSTMESSRLQDENATRQAELQQEALEQEALSGEENEMTGDNTTWMNIDVSGLSNVQGEASQETTLN